LCAGHHINLDERENCPCKVPCAFYFLYYTFQYHIWSCPFWTICWYSGYCRSVCMVTPTLQLQTGGNTFIYFSCFPITIKFPAGHCLCLTVSVVVYTPHVHH
jgi:hypothetical protein